MRDVSTIGVGIILVLFLVMTFIANDAIDEFKDRDNYMRSQGYEWVSSTKTYSKVTREPFTNLK